MPETRQERRLTRGPPSQVQPAAPDWRGGEHPHIGGACSPQRGRRSRSARAPAPPSSRSSSSARNSSVGSAPRIGSRLKLRLSYSANERVREGWQRFKWHGALGWFDEWRGVFTAHGGEAAHLIPLLGAPIWQKLSVERRRAASERARALSSTRAFARTRPRRILVQRGGGPLCIEILSGLVRCRGRAVDGARTCSPFGRRGCFVSPL